MEKILFLQASNQKTESAVSLERTKEEITVLYDQHIDMVYRICFSLLGNKADAEDAAQAVFLKLMKSDMRFVDTEHEKAWLITTARNQCRDIHRQWWRKNVVALDKITETAAADIYASSGETMDAVMRLQPKLRIVVYLHYYEGYKLSEIADLLELNINTVKTQIRAAKRQLKIELGDDLYDEKRT